MGTTDISRYRFSVPVQDKVVHDWIHNQSNLGFSLRVLIKEFVKEYGSQDATCLELGEAPKRRGRPTNAMRARMEQGMADKADQTGFDSPDEQSYEKPAVRQTDPVRTPVEQIPAQQPGQQNNSVKVDDDGFVDPESLF